MVRRLFYRAPGQAAVLTALILPFLTLLLLVGVEQGERWMQVALVEDALQQAARSAVQTFDYQALADAPNQWSAIRAPIRATGACVQVAAHTGPCAEVTGLARGLFLTNLHGVRGLVSGPALVADAVRWTVLPAGGTCTYTTTTRYAPVTRIGQPLLCAEVRLALRGLGLFGRGGLTVTVVAAETLDPVSD